MDGCVAGADLSFLFFLFLCLLCATRREGCQQHYDYCVCNVKQALYAYEPEAGSGGDQLAMEVRPHDSHTAHQEIRQVLSRIHGVFDMLRVLFIPGGRCYAMR